MKFLIAFICLWAIAYASSLKAEGRIVNGLAASYGQFPFMALLEVDLGYGFRRQCGAALIGSQWVITAAHCIDNPGTGNIMYIYLGITDTNDAEIGYVVWTPHTARVHPFWRRESAQNDIALIQIPDTPPCNRIRPVRLPPLNPLIKQTYVGEIGVVSGWGKTEYHSGHPIRLQWGFVKITNNEICRRAKPWFGDTEICGDTSMDYVTTCDGDSGGPLVLESTGELVGILSHSMVHNCDKGEPIIITRVTSYLQWIKSITGISY